MKCQCIYLHGDWCHCPDFEFQEQCPYHYFDQYALFFCEKYQSLVNGINSNGEMIMITINYNNVSMHDAIELLRHNPNGYFDGDKKCIVLI